MSGARTKISLDGCSKAAKIIAEAHREILDYSVIYLTGKVG